jgi:homoserine dehydrogenase
VHFEEVTTEGISKISTTDFKYADELGCVVKLLATSYRKDGKVYVITAPFMIDSTHPLYNVNDVLNGIYVNGNVLGNVMFFGAGAGKLPTASAVVADVVDCVKHRGTNVMTVWAQESLTLGKTEDEVRSFFVRVKGDYEKDAAAVRAAFGNVKIVTAPGVSGEFGFVTDEMTEKLFNTKAAAFDVVNRIRIDKTVLNV